MILTFFCCLTTIAALVNPSDFWKPQRHVHQWRYTNLCIQFVMSYLRVSSTVSVRFVFFFKPTLSPLERRTHKLCANVVYACNCWNWFESCVLCWLLCSSEKIHTIWNEMIWVEMCVVLLSFSSFLLYLQTFCAVSSVPNETPIEDNGWEVVWVLTVCFLASVNCSV